MFAPDVLQEGKDAIAETGLREDDLPANENRLIAGYKEFMKEHFLQVLKGTFDLCSLYAVVVVTLF